MSTLCYGCTAGAVLCDSDSGNSVLVLEAIDLVAECLLGGRTPT